MKSNILLGYALFGICSIFFIAQAYLALHGHVISYFGAFVAVVCGWTILKSIKKLESV